MEEEKEKGGGVGKCGGCGREERRLLLHNVVRQRAAHRRLCTDCVLKTHLGRFCAFCYHVYDDDDDSETQTQTQEDDDDSHRHQHQHQHQQDEEEKVMCLKCPCVSHPWCVPLSHPHSPPSFLCPPCSHNNNNLPFSFFRTKPLNPHQQPPPHHRALDQDSARALVAAAKIAAASMSKAAALARLEAERRVKEAALAKKRAREALDKLAHLAASSHNNAAIGNKRPRETAAAAASLLQSRNGNGAASVDK